MLIRLTTTVAALSLLALSIRPVAAQPKPSLPTFEVIKKVATPQEETLVQGIIKNLQAKFADATFEKQIDDAWAKQDATRVGTLIANATQLNRDQVDVAYQRRSTSLVPGNASVYRLASYDPSSRALNPWYIIIRTKSANYCFSSRGANNECIALGYTPILK